MVTQSIKRTGRFNYFRVNYNSSYSIAIETYIQNNIKWKQCEQNREIKAKMQFQCKYAYKTKIEILWSHVNGKNVLSTNTIYPCRIEFELRGGYFQAMQFPTLQTLNFQIPQLRGLVASHRKANREWMWLFTVCEECRALWS